MSSSSPSKERAFAQDEYDERRARVRLSLCGVADALVLTCPDSIYYLTAYQTPGNPFTALVVTEGTLVLVTRLLEASNAVHRTDLSSSVLTYDEGEDAQSLLASALRGCRVVGYEPNSPRLTVSEQKRMESLLPDTRWVDCSSLLPWMRTIKSGSEISYVRRAARIVDQGMDAACSCVREGVRECDIASAASSRILSLGGEYASYPYFVSAGANGVIGHHAASSDVVRNGDVVFLEFGASVCRYHAARMHCVYVGTPVPEWFEAASRMLLLSLDAGRSALRDGAQATEVDSAMRSAVGRVDGKEVWMSTRSGYSIGTGLSTDWSERTFFISPSSPSVARAGMTVHLIPWIQIQGIGAMGFSDTVLVQEEGGAVSLVSEREGTLAEVARPTHSISRAELSACKSCTNSCTEERCSFQTW